MAYLPYNRRGIEHISQTREIEWKYYELKFIEDNSSPCAFCAFLESLKCKFPDGYKKECSHERGTHKGWNTREYVRCEESGLEITSRRKEAGVSA